MSDALERCRRQIDELLGLPDQAWLLGAGISKDAGIPLMFPLTDRVEACLDGDHQSDFRTVRSELPDTAHVEHVLSHIGDLLAIAGRSKRGKTRVGKSDRTVVELKNLHGAILAAIRDTIRWGYVPAEDAAPEKIGAADKPIVTIDGHLAFVNALFRGRRSGLEGRRPPVVFFTTNYDTLLEDALSLCRVQTYDGFSGGAMAFWDSGDRGYGFGTADAANAEWQAKVYKLHGSIDWFTSDEDIVVRRREGAGYPKETSDVRLLIYPQATKYQVTQKDPFATLFSCFRQTLATSDAAVLAVCGYSFADDHINEEIERALKQRSNRLTLLAFCHQPMETNGDEGLPKTIVDWMSPENASWNERIIVAGRRGVYHGSLENQAPTSCDKPYEWWSFTGVTDLLLHGPETSS